MSRYFLSPHSYACETGGHAVFLDLKRDKYTAVAPEDVGTLRATVHGWPTRAEDAGRTAESDDVIQMLIKEGLLTADVSIGKEATPAHLETPTSTFWTNPRPWPQLTTQRLRTFVSVWAMTTLMLQTLPIGWIVHRAQRRKEREAHRAALLDLQKARELATIHFVFQPAFYSAKDACLRNSLTLIEFLARYKIYPTWVFGVKMQPFAAHSWVQHGPVVFTDPIAHVKTFTPIMLI